MSSEKDESRDRGVKVLHSADGIIQDYKAAMKREDWNIAIRRSQEVAELMAKSLIYSSGETKGSYGHGNPDGKSKKDIEFLETVLKLFKSKGESLLSSISSDVKRAEYSTKNDVPLAIIMHYADSKESGHLLNIYQSTIRLLKLTEGQTELLWEHDLPEHEDVLRFYDEKNFDGFIEVTAGKRVAVRFNETGGVWLYDDNVRPYGRISQEAWDKFVASIHALAKWRDPAFYREENFSEAQAQEAGEHMKWVYAVVKKIIGLPKFDWEPDIT